LPQEFAEVIADFGAGKPAIAAIPDPNGNPKTNLENLGPDGKCDSIQPTRRSPTYSQPNATK